MDSAPVKEQTLTKTCITQIPHLIREQTAKRTYFCNPLEDLLREQCLEVRNKLIEFEMLENTVLCFGLASVRGEAFSTLPPQYEQQ